MPNYPAVIPSNLRGVLPQLPATVPPAGATQGQPGAVGGFQGFPNFNVPFPYANMPQQLQASMQMPQGQQQYGRFAPQLPPQAQATLPPQAGGFPQSGMPQQPASGLPQLPGAMNASNLPQGPGGGMPGFAPSSSQSYQQMKANTLNQLSAGQRQRAQAQQDAFDPQQFLQTFNSLPTDEQKFLYYRSQPLGAANQALSAVMPNLGQWTNNLDYNGTLGGTSLTNLKMDPRTMQIRGLLGG